MPPYVWHHPIAKSSSTEDKGDSVAVGSRKKNKQRQWPLSWRSSLAVLFNIALGVGISIATQSIRLSPWLAPWSWAALIILAAVFVVVDHHNQKSDQMSSEGTATNGGSSRRNPALGMYVVLIIVAVELAVVIIAVVAISSTAVTNADLDEHFPAEDGTAGDFGDQIRRKVFRAVAAPPRPPTT